MTVMRMISPDQLKARLSSLPPNPRVVMSGNMVMPREATSILDDACETYILHALNAPPGVPVREGVTAETTFVGAGMRKHPNLRYVASRLSLVPMLYSSTLPPDVVIVHCAPAIDGMLSLGLEVNVLPRAIEACRARGGLVIAIINENMPYTYGDAQVPVEHVDMGVEINEDIIAVPPRAPDDESRAIGASVASMISDGSTLQMGIGAVPDATLAAVTHLRDLRIWTEMFSDGVLALDEAGALDKTYPITSSFIFGSDELYAWVNKNPRVRMLRTEKTNDPGLIAMQRKMMSVNTALQVDLFGQANASRINARIYSGFGGQTDFIVGALHSPGGKSFIALRSWHHKANVSTIVPMVKEPVTSFQQSAIVTENGVANLWGYSQREQADAIINNAAHPDVRESLRDSAKELGLA